MVEGSYDYHHYMQVCLAAVYGRILRTSGAKFPGIEMRLSIKAYILSSNMIHWPFSARVCAVKGLNDSKAMLPVPACHSCLAGVSSTYWLHAKPKTHCL